MSQRQSVLTTDATSRFSLDPCRSLHTTAVYQGGVHHIRVTVMSPWTLLQDAIITEMFRRGESDRLTAPTASVECSATQLMRNYQH